MSTALDALQVFKEQKRHIQNSKDSRNKSSPVTQTQGFNVKKDPDFDLRQERLAQYNLMIQMVDKANKNVNY